MDTFIRAVRLLSRITGVVAALLIAGAVLVICDMVIERYGFNRTTIWQIDVVTYSIVAATFVGSPYVLLHRGHVNVDILPLHLGPRARYWLALFTAGLSFAFCAVLWWLCTRFWYQAWTLNWRSDTVWRARLWIPYLSMPVGLGLLVLQYVVELVCVATGRTQPFGGEPDPHAHEIAA
ncbi:MAG TPA: TRAP transporter small permease [Usitatibacter sp.]|nr:TRAP transporter small permease [Usitatibacter sp.]HXS52715.1 TRAP transporter small permease [Usitatibacter sp.]